MTELWKGCEGMKGRRGCWLSSGRGLQKGGGSDGNRVEVWVAKL